MKFKNRSASILWIVLLCWSGIIHALNPNDGAKSTVYPSVLYPGKVWTVSPPAENISQHNNIWQNNDVNTTRYRPLEDETPQIPQTRSATGEYCIPKPSDSPSPSFENDAPTQPRYRGEYDDMPETPRYRSEMNHESYQPDNRYRQRAAPHRERERLPPQFSPSYWQSRTEQFYDDDFFAMPYRPTLELMNNSLSPEDFLTYPPLNPGDWSPYMRNNFSSKNAPPAPPTQQAQVPAKNERLPPSAELTISADWIPAPNSALVDSEEFTPNYAETQVPTHSNDDNVAVGKVTKP